MENVLVTGYTGFLGKSIFDSLSGCYRVYGLSRNSGDYILSLESIVPDFIDNFDLIIHCAGKAHNVPRTELEKEAFYKVNYDGTLNLLKGLEKSGLPKQFVFISSVAVYGKEEGRNIDEECALLAKDSYGLSKIKAEELITKWCEEKNIICTILRLPLLVGKKPPGNLGAMLNAIKKGYYFNIGGGKAKKSMVLVRDVASFIPIVTPVGGIYNLTDGLHPSFYELSSVIAENKNKKRPFDLPLNIAKLIGCFGDFLGEKAPVNSLKIKKITSDLTFDDSKARELLGWNPQSVLEYLKNNSL